MVSLGVAYESGNGVGRSYAEAMRWYQKAAAQNNADAMIHVGALYFEGHGVHQDRNEALAWYRKAAAGGNQHAKDLLAQLGASM
jgi:TPR repeat protein